MTLAYSEPAESEIQAIRSERQIKGWTRAKKEALIAGDLELLKRLSRKSWQGQSEPYRRFAAGYRPPAPLVAV